MYEQYLHLDEIRKEDTEDEYCKTAKEHKDGLLGNTLPFLEDDTPDIGECNVESHKYAPAEGDEYGEGCEEALAEAQTEELAVPEKSGKSTEDKVVAPYTLLCIV